MDILLKINSPSSGRKYGNSALMNPLPDCSNDSPFCHTHYLILRRINTSPVSRSRPFTKPLRWLLILHCCSALLQNRSGTHVFGGEPQCLELNNKQRQVVMFLLLLFKLSSQLPFVSLFSRLSLSPLFSLS